MRINLWGGAGCGKSTLASGCFYSLKCKNWNIELVHEYIKKWAYENKKPKSFDQIYIFGKQLNAEDSLLQNGVDHLITDSPMLLQVFYAKRYDFPCWTQLMEIANVFESKYPSVNILLNREGVPYHQGGRYETEIQAQEVDTELKIYMDKYVREYQVFKSRELDRIVAYVDHVLSLSPPIPEPPDPGFLIRALRKFLS